MIFVFLIVIAIALSALAGRRRAAPLSAVLTLAALLGVLVVRAGQAMQPALFVSTLVGDLAWVAAFVALCCVVAAYLGWQSTAPPSGAEATLQAEYGRIRALLGRFDRRLGMIPRRAVLLVLRLVLAVPFIDATVNLLGGGRTHDHSALGLLLHAAGVVLAVCLVLGLRTRYVALALLLLSYDTVLESRPDRVAELIMTAALAATLVTFGGGGYALDTVLRRRARMRRRSSSAPGQSAAPITRRM